MTMSNVEYRSFDILHLYTHTLMEQSNDKYNTGK